MIMLISSEKGKKGPGGILGGILDGSRLGKSVGQKNQVEMLIKKMDSTGKRCGAVFKRQKIIDAKIEIIAKELGIKLDPQNISVDYGAEEITYFEDLIKNLEDNGGDIGILTKISAMNKLLRLFSKMSKNVGAAAEGVKRTEKVVDEISKRLIKEE